MHETARFPPDPSSVTRARHWLVDRLTSHGRSALVPAAELCLSELAANAVRHARTDFEVELSDIGDGGVRLAVSDENPERPHRRPAAPLDLDGRGLNILAALADDWGVADHPPAGKIIWCTLTVAGSRVSEPG
jgi:serine/threonine-protein kinase RsbW